MTAIPLDFTPAQKRIQSMLKETGLFTAGVELFEPTNVPGKGLFVAIWLDDIVPVPGLSGQDVTSGRVMLILRVYLPMFMKPEEKIDQRMGEAVGVIMGLLSSDIDLQDNVMAVDLLGLAGIPLSAKGGYITLDTTQFRVMNIFCPLLISDIWLQGV